MAIEAITQISPGEDIVGCELKDVDVLRSLVIPSDSDKVSVEFRLKPVVDSSDKSNSWADFCLYVIRNNDSFLEICKGSIKAVSVGPGRQQESHDAASQKEVEHIRTLISSAEQSFNSEIEPAKLYNTLSDSGHQYGPLFQGFQRARRHNDGRAVGNVMVSSPPSNSASGTRPSAIHPCDLDCVLQLGLPAVVRDTSSSGNQELWVPTYVSKLWVPATGFQRQHSQVQTYASTQTRSIRLCETTIQAIPQDLDKATSTSILTISGAELTLISSTSLSSSQSNPPSHLSDRLSYNLVHLPDHTSMTAPQAMEYIHSHTTPSLQAQRLSSAL